MPYKVAGIDVHKRMLAVVVADVAMGGEYEFERRQFGSSPEQLRLLAEWLIEEKVQEAVMESTAQYWKRCGGNWKANTGCTWRRLSPTVRCVAAKKTSGMPSGWYADWWREN